MDKRSTSTEHTLEDFAYDLPPELIAQQPPPVRHASRLLSVERASGKIVDSQFTQLPQLLRSGDLLVVNDTKVIPARLLARRQTGAQIEILLLRPEAVRPGVWLAMASPLRRLKPGEVLLFNAGESEFNAGESEFDAGDDEDAAIVDARSTAGVDAASTAIIDSGSTPAVDAASTVRVDAIVEAEDGSKRVLLDFGSQENVYKTLTEIGLAPLPPYIKRALGTDGVRAGDLERYQTIFAAAPGAVAAPTAGLHFSPEIFRELEETGVGICKITLHVGPGTFKPITSSLEEHSIETERFSISQQSADTINKALEEGRRVIAVGTTSCRALETAGASGRVIAQQDASTGLYIRPGFQFKVISALVTNFHLSRSSLLVLVSAFGGYDVIMRAYKHAVEQRYRFYSYGDAMLIT